MLLETAQAYGSPVGYAYVKKFDKAVQELRGQIAEMHDNLYRGKKRALKNTPEYYLMQVLDLIGKKK